MKMINYKMEPYPHTRVEILPDENGTKTMVKIKAPDIGYEALILLSEEHYDDAEIVNVAEMSVRTITAWNRGRELREANPEQFGIAVN